MTGVVPDKNIHSKVKLLLGSSRHHHLAITGVQCHWGAALLTGVMALYSVNYLSKTQNSQVKALLLSEYTAMPSHQIHLRTEPSRHTSPSC